MAKKEPATVTSAKITRTGAIIVAIIGLFGVLFTIYSQVTPKPTAQITEYTGRVIDMNTLQPISNAKITLSFKDVPPVVYTDSEGVYRFGIEIEATISGQIWVDAVNYQPYTRHITISADSNILEDIRLSPLGIQALPTPTDTPLLPLQIIAPTSTFTPTSTPPSSTTIFEDTFIDNRNSWFVTSDTPFIGAGKYNFGVGCPANYDSYFCGTYVNVPFEFPRNFHIEVDLKVLKPSADAQIALGFQIRRNDNNHYYINYFITDMSYVFRSAYNTKDLEIIQKTSTTLINTDPDAINRLGIEIHDTRFTPIINGNRLPEGEDGNLTNAGQTFLVIYISRGSSATVQFDNLIVQEVK